MARGDAFVQLIQVPGSGTVDIQPPAGVEIMITAIIADGANVKLRAKTSAGATSQDLVYALTAGETTVATTPELAYLAVRGIKLFITNSVFIQLVNAGTSARYVFISGVQTK